MKSKITYYKGILRCQFSTQRPREIGSQNRSIFSCIALEPTFELYACEQITESDYSDFIRNIDKKTHIKHSENEILDYYHITDAPDGKRMNADEIYMGIQTEPKIIEDKFYDWNDLKFESLPEKYLHDCFIAYHPNSNHGRISGPVVVRRIQQLDENEREINNFVETEQGRISFLERQGWFQESRGCVNRIFGFNLRLKNWLNSIFGGIFGSNLIGNEPNGCAPTLLPSGCSGIGCQRFGCGILGILLSLAFLFWLLKSLLFGPDNNTKNGERIVEKIVHDTVYIEKNSQVDTVTYVDETTNTTVKMLSLPNVQFEKNKAILLRSSIPQLNELAAYLIENKGIEAEIIGHTDSDGDAEANRILSQNRAEALRQYLIENGVESWRIKATGKGESDPVTDNSTAEGRAMNRRVEVKLSESSTTKTTRKKDKRKRE